MFKAAQMLLKEMDEAGTCEEAITLDLNVP
jgi:hypothetical protein